MTRIITPPVGNTQYTASTDTADTVTVDTLHRIARAACAFTDEVLAHRTENGVELHAVTDAHDAWVDIAVDDSLLTNGDSFNGEHAIPLGVVKNLLTTCRDSSSTTVTVDTVRDQVSLTTPMFTYTDSLLVTTATPRVLTRPGHDRPVTFQATGDALNAPLTLTKAFTNRVKLAFDASTCQFIITATGDTESLRAAYALPEATDLPSEDVATVVPCDRLCTVNDAIPDDAEVRVAFGDGVSTRVTYQVAGIADVTFTLRALPGTLTD